MPVRKLRYALSVLVAQVCDLFLRAQKHAVVLSRLRKSLTFRGFPNVSGPDTRR